MRYCPACGKANEGDVCVFCGRPLRGGLRSSVWTAREFCVIALTFIGAAILLFTPLISSPLVGSFSYHDIAFNPALSGDAISLAMDYSSEAAFTLIALKAVGLTFYATILLSLVALFRKIDKLTQVFRFISLGLGAILMVALLYIKAEASQSLLTDSLVNVRFGVFLGVACLIAAVVLSYRRDVLSRELYRMPSGSHGTIMGDPPLEKRAGALVCTRGTFSGARFDLSSSPTIAIGRDARSCQIVFPKDMPRISRKHCLVRFSSSENCYYVTDVSRNGTYLAGGVRLPAGQPCKLARGTTITFDSSGANAFYLE
jgi:hypothetical protein